MNLTDISSGASLTGLEPDLVCKVVAVTFIAENALQVVYTLPDGSPKILLISPADAAGKAEASRQLAYRLYTLCERKGWADDARAYNEIVSGWSGIERAAGTGGEDQKSLLE